MPTPCAILCLLARRRPCRPREEEGGNRGKRSGGGGVMQYLAQLLNKKWAVLVMAVSDLERPLLGADASNSESG